MHGGTEGTEQFSVFSVPLRRYLPGMTDHPLVIRIVISRARLGWGDQPPTGLPRAVTACYRPAVSLSSAGSSFRSSSLHTQRTFSTVTFLPVKALKRLLSTR